MADFSLSGGVRVTGFISPTDTADTYAVIDPLYGVDGLRNVDSLLELNTITTERRRAGMIVGVSGGTQYYRLKSGPWTSTQSDWEVLNIGTSLDTYTTGATLINTTLHFNTNAQLSAYTTDLSSLNNTLSGLTDTNISTGITSGQKLVYETSNWVNKSEKIISFSPTGSGQTIFTNILIESPIEPSKSSLYINGQKQFYGIDFDISGTTVGWFNNNFMLDNDDLLEMTYI